MHKRNRNACTHASMHDCKHACTHMFDACMHPWARGDKGMHGQIDMRARCKDAAETRLNFRRQLCRSKPKKLHSHPRHDDAYADTTTHGLSGTQGCEQVLLERSCRLVEPLLQHRHDLLRRGIAAGQHVSIHVACDATHTARRPPSKPAWFFEVCPSINAHACLTADGRL